MFWSAKLAVKAAREKAHAVSEKLRSMRLPAAAKCFHDGMEETLSDISFPRDHWTRVRNNIVLEQITKEVHRRIGVVGAYPDGRSALILVATRLHHIAGTKWGMRRRLDTDRLHLVDESTD